MSNILVECPQCIASVRVGVLEPLQYLGERALCKVRYRDTKQITCEDIAWSDVLICVRGCEYPTLRVVQAAKRAGRFIVYFLDDDLLHIPTGNASTKYYSDYKIQQNLTKILSLCDVLWAVNPRIIEYYRHWCSRTVLTRVPAKIVRASPKVTDVIRIIFAGSVDHSALVQEKLSPAVTRLLSEFPGKVEFTFIGASPQLPEQRGLHLYSYFDSYDAYQELMISGNYSLGLAPSYDTSFYACKYYNKFIEYTSYGILGIYEAVPPYTDIVRDGENGYLCGGDAENWYRKIKKVVLNCHEIQEKTMTAQDELFRNFSHKKVSFELFAQLPELESFCAAKVGASEVYLPQMRWLFYQERIRLLIRMYGILACFVIAIKAVRKIMKLFGRKLEK